MLLPLSLQNMTDSAPLLEVKNAVKHFSGGSLGRGKSAKALNDVSLSVRAGEILCVVGESGCGKSTLARVIAGLHVPTSGDVFFDGQCLTNMSNKKRRLVSRTMQMIFQNPHDSLNPRMRVGEMLTEAFAFHFPTRPNKQQEAANALIATGMSEDALERYPHQFSGGQRQRISIARALIVEPRFIIADEPIAALDVSVQAQILNLLLDLRQTRQLAYLFITHDLSVVEHFGDRAAVMYLGQICEIGDCNDMFARPRHPYTRILLDAAPKVGKTPSAAKLPGEPPSPLNMPAGCPFHPRCPHANSRCQTENPPLLAEGEYAIACHAVSEGRI